MKKQILYLGIVGFGSLSYGENPKTPLRANDWNNDIYGHVKGKHYVSGGWGMLNLSAPLSNGIIHAISPSWNQITVSNRPIWFAKIERATGKHSGIGFSYAHGGFDLFARFDSIGDTRYSVNSKLSYRTSSYLFRYNYHFMPEKRFDIYVGAAVGYRTNNFKIVNNQPELKKLEIPVKMAGFNKYIPTSYAFGTWGGDMTVGFRYSILPPIAVYFESGLAKSIMQTGVVIRW